MLEIFRRSGRLFAAAFLTAALGVGAAPVPASAQSVTAEPSATAALTTTPPSILFGPLFRDVQLAQIFPDQKTFCDLLPDEPPARIVAEYQALKSSPSFSLAAFVAAHFRSQSGTPVVLPAPPGEAAGPYIASLWNVLQERTATVDQNAPDASLLQLPQPFVAPGGRFAEMYYWDSYFTMLGLEADGRHDVVENMIADFAYEIDTFGHVPNGNRTYYLSRSQPPFFAEMIDLLAQRDGPSAYVRYLPELQREYDYWMAGSGRVPLGRAYRNVVRLPLLGVLNRYYDERDVPRDESYLEDVQTAASTTRSAPDLYRNLRATAESGWDFSSRWLADGKTLATVETLDLIPVDLNALLEHLESTLSHAYELKDDQVHAIAYSQRATQRTAAIRTLLWDSQAGIFGDWDWRTGRLTHRPSAATLYPLYEGIATPQQAAAVARAVQTSFLEPNGVATTLVASGQQWDQPNGWAPLQWIAVTGLNRYGDGALARTIAQRWKNANLAVFARNRKFVEKYDLLTTSGGGGGGGEYATQIGFGWTNGVLRGFMQLDP